MGGAPGPRRRAVAGLLAIGCAFAAAPAAAARPRRGGAVDLWSRLRRRFALPALDSPLVPEHQRRYANRPEHVHATLARATRFLRPIVDAVEAQALPGELALLPAVESGFDPDAVSPAQAVGLWQFVADTAREFDLMDGSARDDRRDPAASTRAALAYLKRLHARFADWHLALAAYNAGEGLVERALAAARRGGIEPRYENLELPEETRHYVPRLLALSSLVAQPGAHGLALPDLPDAGDAGAARGPRALPPFRGRTHVPGARRTAAGS